MKCTLVVSQHRQKAVCKSRPGNLLSSAWCFWIVHECAYHVQAKDGFQFLCLYGAVFQNMVTYSDYWKYNKVLNLLNPRNLFNFTYFKNFRIFNPDFSPSFIGLFYGCKGLMYMYEWHELAKWLPLQLYRHVMLHMLCYWNSENTGT